MYQNVYQNGQIVEILSPQGGSCLKNVKTIGPVTKSYEKQIKGYAFMMEHHTSCKLQFPKDDKLCLALLQPYLVLQIYIPKGKSFTIELLVADSSKTRRRMLFTTNTKELVINALHARVPLNYVAKNSWLNLSLDVAGFSSLCFKGTAHRAIDGIILGAHCKIRRIFTMKSPIMDTTDDKDLGGSFEMLPKSVEYPMGVCFSNQLYTVDKISVDSSGEEIIGLNAMHIEPSKPTKTISLAFGSRAPKVDSKSPEHGTITGAFDKTKKRGFNLTANQDFNKQLTNTTSSIHTNISSNHSTQGSISKRSSRFKDLRRGPHAHVLRTPDINCPRTPLELHAHDRASVERIKERDKSEPPRKYTNDKSKSPQGRAPSGTCHTKQPSRTHGLNIVAKKSCAQKQIVFDKSAESIQEQAEDDTTYKNLKKSGSEIEIQDYCQPGKPTKPLNGKKGNTKNIPKPRLKPAANKHLTKTSVTNNFTKRKSKVEPGSEKKKTSPEEAKPTPSAMLLQTVGANQLNTFGLNDYDNEPSDEIEEVIEADDKQSMVSHKDYYEHDATPLAKSIMNKEKKWVVAREQKLDFTEKVESEAEEMETIENQDSIAECAVKVPNSLMNTGMAFRPFTPPFAQFQASPGKLKQSLKQSTKGENAEKAMVKDNNIEFGGINEVFGEDEEKIDVVYDPILKCYYDPKTGNYYQLEQEY